MAYDRPQPRQFARYHRTARTNCRRTSTQPKLRRIVALRESSAIGTSSSEVTGNELGASVRRPPTITRQAGTPPAIDSCPKESIHLGTSEYDELLAQLTRPIACNRETRRARPQQRRSGAIKSL